MEAMNALGSFKDPAALPQLIALAKETAPNRSDRRRIADHERGTLLRAIGNMADASAVPVLVEALTENANRRRDVIKVLKGLRSEAWPLIEQRLASGEISAQLEPEIRAAFESGAIAKWRIIGPFENVWAAVHPPEADALANGGAADLAKQYESSQAQPVSWREVAGEGEQARLDLERLLRNNGLAAAYAYAQIDASEAAEAKIFAGSDDQLAIWLNGEKVHDFAGTRSFAPDTDEVPVRLRAGVNHLLVKIGNQSGTWEFAARMPGLQGSTFVRSKEPAPEVKQRAFALATKPDGAWLHAGDAVRGEKLFFDPNAPMGAICATCHVVKGKGGIIGPELSAVGTNYKRADLITSIHEPAKTIALGYEQVMVETRSGEAIVGSLRSEAGDVLTILSADGQTHTVSKNQVKTTTHLQGSLMPPGLTLSLKPEEFADLLAYLESLRGH
jgi:putative heme-binding domain-containing protein